MELDFTLENLLLLVCAYACIHVWRTLSTLPWISSIWSAPTRVYTLLIRRYGDLESLLHLECDYTCIHANDKGGRGEFL